MAAPQGAKGNGIQHQVLQGEERSSSRPGEPDLEPFQMESIATARAAAAELTTFAATAAATRSALFARSGEVDSQSASIDGFAIHTFDGFGSLFRCAHGDEAKTAWAAGRSIHHQVSLSHGAKLGKCVLQVVFGSFEGKISNKQFIIHVIYTGRDSSLSDRSRTPGLKSSLNQVHLRILHILKLTSYRTGIHVNPCYAFVKA